MEGDSDPKQPGAAGAPVPTADTRSAAPPARAPDAGRDLTGLVLGGRYTLLARVGVGGMGQVWRARDANLGAHCAVKILGSSFAEDSTLLARFEQEARIMADLKSPYILRVEDLGLEDGLAFYTMRYLEGETLQQAIARSGGGLRYADVRRILEQLLLGVAAAHAQGIVHRDLKPANLFLEDQAEGELPLVRILDFGVARSLEATTRTLTKKDSIVGTPFYLPPEVFRPGVVRPHPRMDIYAVGLIAYEMVTGERLWGGRTLGELSQVYLSDGLAPPPLLHTTEPGRKERVAPAFSRIVARALEYDPERRYANAREMLEALRALDRPDPADLPADLVVNDRYRIVRRLGQGGMGAVYEVQDIQDELEHRRVALKILVSADVPERLHRELGARFDRECQVLMNMRHPNLLPLFDKDRWQGHPFSVMEYVAGRTLADVAPELRGGSWAPILDIADQVAAGLDELHRAGIVHRDVKPDNILVEPSGRVRVIDYGIARLPASALTDAGIVLGTEGFVAPEQERQARDATPQTDQWALGATVYWALTGVVPGERPGQSGQRATGHGDGDEEGAPRAIVPLGELRPDLPEHVAAAVARALAAEADARFATVTAFARALRGAALPEVGAAARQASTAAVEVAAARSGGARWRRWLPAAALAVAAVGSLAVWRIAGSSDSARAPARPRAAEPRAAEPATEATRPGATPATDSSSPTARSEGIPAEPGPEAVSPAGEKGARGVVPIIATRDGKHVDGVRVRVNGQEQDTPFDAPGEPGTTLRVEVVDSHWERTTTACTVPAAGEKKPCEVPLGRRRGRRPASAEPPPGSLIDEVSAPPR